MWMTLRMHHLHEVSEGFANTAKQQVGLQAQVVHQVAQLVALIALSVDQEWSADQVNMEASMGAASTHIAKA